MPRYAAHLRAQLTSSKESTTAYRLRDPHPRRRTCSARSILPCRRLLAREPSCHVAVLLVGHLQQHLPVAPHRGTTNLARVMVEVRDKSPAAVEVRLRITRPLVSEPGKKAERRVVDATESLRDEQVHNVALQERIIVYAFDSK